ncbi:MAG: T9SS type A sorting domain-containing protein [Bacteroidetes bacterium]|nr:T9SS type A sorting domain-containing protein [Bacteroidota bacterium]
MKRITTSWVITLFLLSTASVFGQYVDDGVFPDTNSYKIGGRALNGALGVDPEGKVWFRPYYNDTDSIMTANGTNKAITPIYVFNANGTQASFSPIKILTGPDQDGAAVTDTLTGTNTGGRTNPSNGNFVINVGTKAGFAAFWEVNYKTGEGVIRIATPYPANNAGVGIDGSGNYYTANVLGGLVGQVISPTGSLGDKYAESVPEIGRHLAVSRDGKDVYVPRFTAHKIYVYHSEDGDGFGPYALVDSFGHGSSSESIEIHPTTGHVWFSNDSVRSVLDTVSATPRAWGSNVYYEYDPKSKTIVDSIQVDSWRGIATLYPRGIAFSPTGDTMYVSHFDGRENANTIRRFIKGTTSVKRNMDLVANSFSLAQNYPNPFNPSTKIDFSLTNAATISLKVYDMLGREIATLAQGTYSAGVYNVNFDAKNISAGMYFYTLKTSDGFTQTKKMLLIK